jgi:hypothetical protein
LQNWDRLEGSIRQTGPSIGMVKGHLYIFGVRKEPSKLGGEKIFRQPALRALNKIPHA